MLSCCHCEVRNVGCSWQVGDGDVAFPSEQHGGTESRSGSWGDLLSASEARALCPNHLVNRDRSDLRLLACSLVKWVGLFCSR